MYKLSDIKQLHFEPTNRCNAKCPLCTRTGNKIIEGDPAEHTLDFIRTKFPVSLLRQLDLIKWCGNAGDPPLCKDFIPIQQYLISVNPQLRFVLHTNGGVKTPEWWKQLGEIYKHNPNNLVNFHIDGLQDTNHLYRVNVVFERIMENAAAFISTGARAHWVFIPFQHNEHQIEEARTLSDRMGFARFDVKVSARQPQHTVTMYKTKRGETKELRPPSSFDVLQADRPHINCSAQKRKELFVDCWGNVTPCCWMGTFDARPHSETYKLLSDSRMNIDDINLYHTPIEKIVESVYFQSTIVDSWHSDNPAKTCFEHCRGSKTHMWMIDGKVVPQR